MDLLLYNTNIFLRIQHIFNGFEKNKLIGFRCLKYVCNSNNFIGKKKKRKARQKEESPPKEEEPAIDPDEPTYCLCDQISYGEMIMCDNDLCPIEWFHFSCVTLTTKPKGKWYCPKCRGDRPNVMKPKAQFLRELEKYNKEKEEKT